MCLANHHDNFDLYSSSHQPWNSTRVGPQKDLVGGWAKAAKKQGLRFGVSVHAAHTWSWLEVAQRADQHGPLAGVPYDERTIAADGRGTWWQGSNLSTPTTAWPWCCPPKSQMPLPTPSSLYRPSAAPLAKYLAAA